MKDNASMITTAPKTPASAMTVPQREMKPAVADEREMRFVPFASDTEIKLTVAIVTNLICIPTRSGARCSPQDAIKFMMMCQARKLNPFEGDAFLQGYDSKSGPTFNLITAHQAFLKRAEVNDQYDGMESGVVVMDDKGEIQELQGDFYPKKHLTLVGGWARVHLKHRKVPMYRRLDLATFNKGYGRWEDDPAGMIVKCAEADALRSAFPTMLGNLYLEQELNPEKNITPAPQINAPSFISNPPSLPPPTQQPPQQPDEPTPDPTPAPVQQPADETEQPKPAAESAPPPAQPIEDRTAHLDSAGVINLIKDLMKRDNVSEDQVIIHLRTKKIAKPAQKELLELSDTKLRNLVNSWNSELTGIRSITI